MIRSIICAAAAALSLGAGTVGAEDAATATAFTAGDAVRIRYVLPSPTARLAFADRDVVRETWTVLTPGVTLAGGVISGETPFETVELEVRADSAERDRIYMGISRVGDGHILYGPALRLEGVPTTLLFQAAEGAAVLPAEGAIEGYAYLGPDDQVSSAGEARVVAGRNVSAELAGPMRETFRRALEVYGARLGPDLPYTPTLAISVDSPGPAMFRGDVTDTGVISTRFRGDVWRGAEEHVATFVWHEAFHLWNGHGIGTPDADTDPWLHEGGAEYASIVGAASTGAIGEGAARRRLAQHLNGCRATLAERSEAASRLRSGSGPYACGTLIQWIADMELRQAGRGDILALWRDMLAEARRDGDYGVADFRARLAPDSRAMDLLDGPGEGRWARIEARLNALGVALENQPEESDLMAAALFHVAKRNCRGSYGFFNDPGALRLDGADCGVLSGEPLIATVEDLDPQGHGRAMFEAVQTRCAAGLPVRYRTRDDRVLEATCDAPLAEPRVWAITAAPPFDLE
jgi:hypothetical protein